MSPSWASIAGAAAACPAPGHTPGHIVVEVASGDQRLYYIGDTVLYPLHLEYLDWLPIYDIVPELAVASKHAIFDRAAEERARLPAPSRLPCDAEAEGPHLVFLMLNLPACAGQSPATAAR